MKRYAVNKIVRLFNPHGVDPVYKINLFNTDSRILWRIMGFAFEFVCAFEITRNGLRTIQMVDRVERAMLDSAGAEQDDEYLS